MGSTSMVVVVVAAVVVAMVVRLCFCRPLRTEPKLHPCRRAGHRSSTKRASAQQPDCYFTFHLPRLGHVQTDTHTHSHTYAFRGPRASARFEYLIEELLWVSRRRLWPIQPENNPPLLCIALEQLLRAIVPENRNSASQPACQRRQR